MPQTEHTERIRTALTGPQSGAVLVSDLADGVSVVDASDEAGTAARTGWLTSPSIDSAATEPSDW
ncbi:hypothetical protein GCM10010464_30800 [Pseudonocardia yunnanensis]